MKLLLCLLLTCVGLSAQEMPPQQVESVGMVLRKQDAHQGTQYPVPGTQLLGLFADPAMVLPDQGLGPRIRPGGQLWLFGAGCSQLSGQPGSIQMTGSGFPGTVHHYFSLSFMDNNMSLMPLGALGHSSVFSSPSFLISPSVTFETVENGYGALPIWAMTQDISHVFISQPWLANFRLINIPNHPALVGSFLTAQSYRLTNPPAPVFHCSDEITFIIG